MDEQDLKKKLSDGPTRNPDQELARYPLHGLDFSTALVHLKSGQKIRRAIWKGHWFLAVNPHCQCVDEGGYLKGFNFQNGLIVAVLRDGGGCAPAQPYQEDLLANDWEVVDFQFKRKG